MIEKFGRPLLLSLLLNHHLSFLPGLLLKHHLSLLLGPKVRILRALRLDPTLLPRLVLRAMLVPRSLIDGLGLLSIVRIWFRVRSPTACGETGAT